MSNQFSFYKFFAGGSMVNAALGASWTCKFANDFDPKKAHAYRTNWGIDHLVEGDVAKVSANQLPGQVDLSWGSFPCQDLSLAGAGAGLQGQRSGTFWAFWTLMQAKIKIGQGPKIIALENVYGAITAHRGDDFRAICEVIADEGYRFGALVINASLWVPQSRPRLFIVAVRGDLEIPTRCTQPVATDLWHPQALVKAHAKLSDHAKAHWLWLSLPLPGPRAQNFVDIIEDTPEGVSWHPQSETDYLLSMMTDTNRDKVDEAIRESVRTGKRIVGGIYRRTRDKVQRAEVRFDDVAGCLRTPTGGSSRQILMVIEAGIVRTRLISARETARLMGLDDSYILPAAYNDAYHLTGDGVAVPVVRALADAIFHPVIDANRNRIADQAA